MFKKFFDKSNIPFFLIIPFGFLVFFLLLFSCVDSVHAASQSRYGLPYVVIPDSSNSTYIDLKSILSNYKGIDLENLPDGSFFYIGGYQGAYGTLYIPNGTPSYTFSLSNSYSSFDYRDNYAVLHLTSSYRKLEWHNLYGTNVGWYGSDGYVNNEYIYFFASNNYPFISKGDYYTDSSNPNERVWTDTIPIYLPTGGDPSVFDDTGLNLDPSLGSSSAPTVPSSFSPTLPNAPTWDSSQPVQSIWDYLTYGFNILSSLLQGLINHFVSWFNYFKSLIGYVIQKILDFLKAIVEWLYIQFLNWLTPYLKIWEFISSLFFSEDTQLSVFDVLFNLLNFVINWLGDFWDNSFISDFWDNMLSYFSNVFIFFRVIVSLGTENGEFSIITLFSNVFRILFIPDSDDLSALLVRHDIYGVLSFAELVQTNVNYIKSLLTVNTRSVNYKFTLPDITIMGVQCGSYDIDFSWYLNYKNVGDPIISAFLIFGWFLWIHGRLPYWLRGQQGDVSGLAREVQK